MSADLASILRGDPASADDLRAALAEIRADGLVLVHRDVLATIAAASTADGTNARHLALVALLFADLDILAESVVSCMWDEWRDLEPAAA